MIVSGAAKHRRGASGLAYAVLLGLIAVTGLAALRGIGGSVTLVLDGAGNRIGAAANGSGGGTTTVEPAPPAAAGLSLTGSGSGMNVAGPGNPATGTAIVFTVTNTGGQTSATPTPAIAPTTNFSITASTCTAPLAAGATCTVTIRPQATADGPYAATLTINANNAPSIALSGTASGFSGATLASCAAWLAAGYAASGAYQIDPDGAGATAPFTGYCDQQTSGGGWLLVTNLVDNTYGFVPEAATSGTAGLAGNYSLNITPAAFTLSERMVRYGAALGSTLLISSNGKMGNGHGMLTGTAGTLMGSNGANAANCRHYFIMSSAGFCDQNSYFPCYNNALAGRERESNSWCQSGWNGALASFIR